MKIMMHILLACFASLTVCATSNWSHAGGFRLQAPDDDKIYTIKEVDVKAKNKMEHLPGRKNDCPDNVSVTLRAVLRKSGKVTDVVIRKSSRCSYDQEAIDAVLQLKFDPAIKDGQQVSQFLDIEFNTTTR